MSPSPLLPGEVAELRRRRPPTWRWLKWPAIAALFVGLTKVSGWW